jgi:hypothetical protein
LGIDQKTTTHDHDSSAADGNQFGQQRIALSLRLLLGHAFFWSCVIMSARPDDIRLVIYSPKCINFFLMTGWCRISVSLSFPRRLRLGGVVEIVKNIIRILSLGGGSVAHRSAFHSIVRHGGKALRA